MTRKLACLALLGLAAWLLTAPEARAQPRPHLGYTYPAGGQQATTFPVRIGGQGIDEVTAVMVTGTGVTARITDCYRRLNNQEIQLLREQLRLLKPPARPGTPAPTVNDPESQELIAKIERRIGAWVQTPACASIASLVMVDVSIAPDAPVGPREIRLVTLRGVSNPLAFEVGPLREYARQPMLTASLQVLGKESAALRKRPAGEAEVRIDLPCTVNGQIASGEVNRYRFEATKGQRLVITTLGRQLIPYIADAVPGWFQPVLVLSNAQGREVAFADDYRYAPDPVIRYQVPEDGEYVVSIHDAIYRGREDFVYRLTVGELPFVTSLFPLGGQVGAVPTPDAGGWNLEGAALAVLPADPRTGLASLVASRLGHASNRVPFALHRLPDDFDRETGRDAATAQEVTLPVVVNGRIDRPDDWDVFKFTGKANTTLVAEVLARQLDSPLDSVIKLTDASGRVLAFNDDRESLTAGVNTHHADSYLMAKLPTDGTYYIHLGDTARKGGEEYGYRLHLSAPQPDFELRVVPSSVSLALNATAAVTVYAMRKDGFTGPIRVTLQNPPPGLSGAAVTLPAGQNSVRFSLKAGPKPTPTPIALSIAGNAKVGDQDIVREAVPAEDKMQAFLWRHLVPASELPVFVFDPKYQPPPKRVAPTPLPPAIQAVAASVAGGASVSTPVAGTSGATTLGSTASTTVPPAPKFTKQQIAGRLRQLKLLYEEGLLSDSFYSARVGECEAGQ